MPGMDKRQTECPAAEIPKPETLSRRYGELRPTGASASIRAPDHGTLHGVAAGPVGTRVDDGREPGYKVVSAEFKQVVDIGEFDRNDQHS
ncbi:hypothetical protein GCM10025331_08390 [Actinoplanes utahensis]|nr:hypothetical protein Aut01nite_15630 [Actinoplanes utahensis]